MQFNENKIRKYCKNKPGMMLTLAMHEKGADTIKSFGNNGILVAPEYRAYEIGSVSKVVLSTLLAKCVEENMLSLSDTIDQYIDLPPGIAYPSLLQLATHTSGYSDPALFDSFFEAVSWSLSSSKRQFNPFDDFKSDWIVSAIIDASRKPKKEKGRFRYSNFGYSVLGHTLGKALGGSYRDCITSFIENDLGLSATSCNSGKMDMVHGFKKGNDYGNWEWSEDSAYAPAGCICSNVADMIAFAKMNLYDERSYLTFSHRKQHSDRLLDIGLGWVIEKDDDIVWHNGRTGLFHTFLAFSKSKKRAIALLSNCVNGLSMPEDKLALSILKSD